MDERRGRPPAEGACADRSDETNPTPVVSITVAASSYIGAPTGASYGCRWDPPSSRLHAAEAPTFSGPRFSGRQDHPAADKPRVRFSDAALRRELPELVRCAARGPLGGTVSSEVIRSSYVGDVTHTGEVPEDVLQRRHDRVLVRTGDVVRHPATPLERRDRRILLDHRQTVGLWLTSDWSRAKMPLSSPRVSPCGLRCSANGCWLVS